MVGEKSPKEDVSDLKQVIKELQSEKNDLINQLELLDTENQQNLAELVGIREHLQEENSEFKEKCQQLKQQNKILESREKKLKYELEQLQKRIDGSHNSSVFSEKSIEQHESIAKHNEELLPKLEETAKELGVLKTTQESLENTLKDTKSNAELKKAEIENKILIQEDLQVKNNELKKKCQQLNQQNKLIASREEKLKQELSELQNRIEESHHSTSHYLENDNQKYENILKNNQELHLKLEEATKELTVLKSTHETLEKTLKDTKINAETELSELLKKSEMDNTIIYRELQKAKEHMLLSEQKSKEDAENCQKLAFILESYDKQVSSLKEELDSIKNEENKNLESQKSLEDLERSKQELQAQLSKALEQVASLENVNNISNSNNEEIISKLTQENADLKRHLEEKSNDIAVLKQEKEGLDTKSKEIIIDAQLKEIENLNERIKEMSLEKETLHRRYVNVITDNVKRYIDSALDSSIQYESIDEPHVKEFSKQVEDIFKMLLDYKEKCQLFEKQVLQISQEKTQLLNEKNSEIEKLIQNSEILSQDIINKTETIKELETEVTNFMTSNDIIMSELDSFKSSGLQTISESNEDNMVLLETDLENAKKRISELEKIIKSDGKLIVSNDSSNTSLEGKVSGKLEDYQELLNSFDDLKIDYDAVRSELADNCNLLNLSETENDDMKGQLERIRSDFENTDYQLSEAKFSIDSLREELEMVKSKLESLLKENKELKLQNMSSIDMKTELNDIKEKWLTEENLRRELESQMRSLKEKHQNSKMTETTLKLQYDTLSKEHSSTLEAKNMLDQTLTSTKRSLVEYENNYTELLQRYDGILLRCEELNTKLHEKDSEVLKLQNEFKVVDEHKQKLEKMLEGKTLELQQHLNQQKTITEDLSNVAQLQVQFQERENEIIRLSNMLKEEELKKMELEKLSENQFEELAKQKVSSKDDLRIIEKQLHLAQDEVAHLNCTLKESQDNNKTLQTLLDKSNEDFAQQKLEIQTGTLRADLIISGRNDELQLGLQEKHELQEQLHNLQLQLKESQENVLILQEQLQELANSRNELINVVTVKHQESLNYHNEIQRLSQILKGETDKYLQLEAQLIQAGNVIQEVAKKSEENDKLSDQNNFLKEKCDLLTKNLLEEQAKVQQALAEKFGPSDKELSLSKQLERLQSHLMELEEHYTQELLQAEQKNAELQTKVAGLEQREKTSSNMYTSVSIRANQQVETLQSQLQLVTNQRDELRKKISDAEDANSKQAAALANLQFVLEQFQKDKEKDIIKETERIRRQINVEKQVQEKLRKEIENLKEQLEESKIGLQAASRLSDQLEIIKKQNSGLKEEVSQLQQKLARSQETIHNLTSQTDGKIDKSLIKNLIVGLLSSGNIHNWSKDQAQIIKLIATVLDFNQQDHDKVKLNQPQHGSWLSSILFPQPSNQNMSQESLTQAFVKFLENESKPIVVPSLLSDQSSRPSTSTESSKRSTPRASPIVLNEIVLPTFADFGHNRNSSSILKDVLKDNNNS